MNPNEMKHIPQIKQTFTKGNYGTNSNRREGKQNLVSMSKSNL